MKNYKIQKSKLLATDWSDKQYEVIVNVQLGKGDYNSEEEFCNLFCDRDLLMMGYLEEETLYEFLENIISYEESKTEYWVSASQLVEIYDDNNHLDFKDNKDFDDMRYNFHNLYEESEAKVFACRYLLSQLDEYYKEKLDKRYSVTRDEDFDLAV